MKIVLVGINAKYIHTNLAVRSLQANAGKYRNEVEIAEYTINHSIQEILSDLFDREPDVVGFSCYLWNIEYVMRLAQDWKKIWPQGKIVVGGPEVSYNPEKTFEQYPFVDLLIRGEGENTFKEVLAWLHGEKQSRAELSGVAYLEEGELHIGPPQKAMDMDDLVFPYESLEGLENKILYYESIRGCPFSCSYCLSSVEKQLRFRDAELVKKELQFFIDREVPQVKFVDRTFNCNHAHAMEIWSYIKEHDNGITNFHFEISADLLREEELALIGTMRPGLIQLEIGVQSTNGATIREIHRTMQLERLKEVVKEVQKHENIHEHLDLIAGLPFEDYDTFAKSFDEIYELRPNQLQLGFLKVLKGSYMYEHAKEYEIEYHSRPPYEVLKTKWLPYEDVLKIRQVEEMLEVYYNSGQFEITMKVLGVLFKSAFFMFQELGKYYERNGYFGMSHARIRRSEILLEFIKETFAGDITAGEQRNITEAGKKADHLEILDIIKESLIFDLYYRENCKSRPAWAKDLSVWKQVTRAYCKNGKQSHVECFSYRFPDKGERVLKELPKRAGKPLYALFDYTDRDPLDHQAKVTWIMEDEDAGLCSH